MDSKGVARKPSAARTLALSGFILLVVAVFVSPAGHAGGQIAQSSALQINESQFQELPDLLLVPFFVVTVLALARIFEIPLIGWLLNFLKKCSPFRIWLENLMCKLKAQASTPKLEWLVYTSEMLEKWTKKINGYVDAYEKALASIVNDVNAYAQALADYKGICNDLQNNGSLESDDPRAASLPGGSGGIYQALQALCDQLTAQSTQINAQLADLLREYNSDVWYAGEIQNDAAQLRAEKAAFIADLQAFLKTLICTKCGRVEAMIAQAQALKDTFDVKTPSLAPPNPVDPPNPPPKPPQPPAGGKGAGGAGGPGQTQEKEKQCECKLEHKVKDEPMELIVSMVTLENEYEDLMGGSGEDNNPHYNEWTFGNDYHDLASAIEGVPLRVHAIKWEKVDVKVSQTGGGDRRPSAVDLQLVIPLADIDIQWSLDEFKVTDSNEKAKNVKLSLQLQGPGGKSGQKVQGSAAILLLSYDSQYVDWFVASPIPHFEGKFVDFQAKLTCTATLRGETATKKLAISGIGKKVEHAEAGVKYVRDAYAFTMKVDPANKRDSIDLPLQEGPTWMVKTNTVQAGTWEQVKQKVPVVDSIVLGDSNMVDWQCQLHSKWSSVSLDLQPAETSLKMKERESHILGLAVKSSADLDVWTGGVCKPDKFQISDVPIDYQLTVTWNYPAKLASSYSAMAKTIAASSGLMIANGRDPILYAPAVEEETTFDVEIKATFNSFAGAIGTDPIEKSVHVQVTVVPYRDMRSWYGESHVLDKMVEKGVLRAADKEPMQLYGASDSSLWTYADLGLKIYGLKVKADTGSATVIDRFKSVAKDAIYAFELSSRFPNADFTILGTNVKLGTPDFAPIPRAEFSKLHPLKRVIEALVGTARLGDLLTESTGRDYFFKEGSMATFNQAWENYFKNVYKAPGDPDWTVPDEAAVMEMTKNVRFGRLRASAANRVNEIIKMNVAAERGLEYKPSLPIEGTPRVVLSEFKGKPELNFMWTEKTKLGDSQRFKITMEVETQIVGGVTKVKQTGKFINFVMELSEEQRILNNTNVARMQVPGPNYGTGPQAPPTPKPGSARTTEELFDMKQTQLAMQSWKNWAVDTAFRRATGSAKNAALVYALTSAYSDLILEAKKNGLGSAAWKFGLGMAAAAGKSFVTQGLLDFSTKMAAYSAELLRQQEEKYLIAFGKQVAKQYASGAARDAEIVLAEKLIEAGRIPFIAGRWTVTRLVPVVGWGLLIYDIAQMTDSISKTMGALIFGPDRTPEQEGWLNPLYSVRQDQVGEYTVVSRGMQLRTTVVRDAELTAASQKRGFSKILNMPEGATIYKTMFDSRATRFVFKDGTELEMADEVIGPNTDWLPKYMRERLPDLLPVRYSGQLPDPRNTQAYDIAKDKWWFYLDSEKTGHVVNKADSATLDKMSADFASGAWSNLDPIDAAYSFMLWGSWRDSCATTWVRLKSGDRNNPYFLTWWRDYNGKQCKVLEHAGHLVIEPHVDFGDLLKDVTLPK